MKRSEISVAIFADYSKAFDTIDFYILLQKMHQLNFSTDFLHWIFNYLSFRQHFVQIDSQHSSLLTSNYGVPQGSILGPVLFNLCVAEMSKITPNSECIQYADDSTLYRSCKLKDKNTCVKQLEEDITSLSKWSGKNNLIFNSNKTKFMIFSSQQLSKYHNLKDDNLNIKCSNTIIERVEQFKIIGVTFDEHLKFNTQLDKILKSSYSTLAILK